MATYVKELTLASPQYGTYRAVVFDGSHEGYVHLYLASGTLTQFTADFTPGKARKLARALRKAAKAAERAAR